MFEGRPLKLNSGLPKPMEKCSTFTPSLRATQKCPNSWTVIRMPRATIKALLVDRPSVSMLESDPLADHLFRTATRQGVRFQQGIELRIGGHRLRCQHGLDNRRDCAETDTPRQE